MKYEYVVVWYSCQIQLNTTIECGQDKKKHRGHQMNTTFLLFSSVKVMHFGKVVSEYSSNFYFCFFTFHSEFVKNNLIYWKKRVRVFFFPFFLGLHSTNIKIFVAQTIEACTVGNQQSIHVDTQVQKEAKASEKKKQMENEIVNKTLVYTIQRRKKKTRIKNRNMESIVGNESL